MTEELLAAMRAVEDCPVRGHIKYLDDTRFVFIGQDPANKETHYLGFRNKNGEDTLIGLSTEAYEGLKWMINENFKGERCRFPHRITTFWQVTPVAETDGLPA